MHCEPDSVSRDIRGIEKGKNMRFALLLLALMATPALADGLPPDNPTYDKPTFDQPEKPTPPETPPSTPNPPERPNNPENDDESNQPREVKVVPKPAPVSCPKVKCVTDKDGHRRAMFTADVPAEMYHLGRNFCATAPKNVEVTACCLAKPDHTYQILYNVSVSKKAHSKAKQFCICALGLD